MRTCLICDEEISQETLKQYPDTEICFECLEIELGYKAIHKRTGERREGSYDDLSNLDKRDWTLLLMVEPEPQPLCPLEISMGADEFGVSIYKQKNIYSMNDLVGLYI